MTDTKITPEEEIMLDEEVTIPSTNTQVDLVEDELLDENTVDKASNYVVSKEYTSAKIQSSSEEDCIHLPSINRHEFDDEAYQNILQDNRDTPWFESVKEGIIRAGDSGLKQDNKNKPNVLFKATNRDSARWVQGVESASGELSARKPKITNKPNTKYSKQQLQLRLLHSLSASSPFTIPLWHSGIWITLKPPSESAILELWRQISSEKLTLGRYTSGLVYSNFSVYTTKSLMNFLKDHIHSHSVAGVDDAKILEYIKVTDLDILIWGLANVTWPNGFNYKRSCVIDPTVCNHVITEKLNLSKLQFVDITLLSERQISHMTGLKRADMTIDSLKTYTSEFKIGGTKEVTINDEISIKLEVPSIAEHINSGTRWVSEIESMYTKAMISDVEDRNGVLLAHAKTTRLRHYQHFFKEAIYNGAEYIKGEEDNEDMDVFLNVMSENNEISKKIMDEVMDYIADSKVSIVGIPRYTCPNCGKEATSNSNDGRGSFKALIALDSMHVFFALLLLKLQTMARRDDM